METNITNTQAIDLWSSELSQDSLSPIANRQTAQNTYSHFKLNFFML